MGTNNLHRLLSPHAVAVIGASDRPDSVGRTLMENLLREEFDGQIFPVNPKHANVRGIACRDSIREVQSPVDLAVIATPIDTVPSILRECAQKNVAGAVVISAGGSEAGEEGRRIEAQIRRIAAESPLRILGPNCLGFIRPQQKLNASFSPHMTESGNLAFVSQSGAIGTAILDYSIREHFGFSHFISVGGMVDVDFGDLIDYLGNHPDVESILIYMESLTRVRRFMSAARAVARAKPIVVLKSGKTRWGAQAAASHTGALGGKDIFYDAAFARAGVVRVDSIGELFDCAELMSKQRRPKGDRLGIITNAGGAGVMAADALARLEVKPAALAETTRRRFDEVLPAFWSGGNPVDILGDATPRRYAEAVDIALEADEFDALLIILTPQAMTDPTGVAESLARTMQGRNRPVFAAWMGGTAVAEGMAVLNGADIPTYETPEEAIRAFLYMREYDRSLEKLFEIPPRFSHELSFDRNNAGRRINEGLLRNSGRLSESESKRLLAAYGIAVNRTESADSEEAAVQTAAKIGYPLVMKVASPAIVHKSEAGGVVMGLRSEADVRRAWQHIHQRPQIRDAEVRGVTLQPMIEQPDFELLIGAKLDDQFGPMLIFGAGGIFTEVVRDTSFGLPPLNRLLARRLMADTRIDPLLKEGYRNRPPVDREALEEILVRLSHLVVDFPQIAELDMNPVIVKDGQPVVVDARVIVKSTEATPPDHLVISPYPAQYEFQDTVSDGTEILIRPIRPEDAPLFEALFESLSPNSIYQRFFRKLKTLSHRMLVQYTQIDYDRQIALVAVSDNRMLGVSRLYPEGDGENAEFSVLVGDPWQGRGIGARLLHRLLEVAKDRGIRRIWGTVLSGNTEMLSLARKLGFEIETPESGETGVRIDLEESRL